jgi:uncharacterized membrane protein
MLLAGDNPAAKEIVGARIEDTGFEPVEAGTIVRGRNQEPGTAVHNGPADTDGVRATLARPEARVVSRNRLEAFSDGVIAVAITPLVLDIGVPPVKANETLAHALLRQWPHYAAYVTSFITIRIIWINHNATIGRLRTADPAILALNLLLLLSIAILPFATSLMAAYLKQSKGQHLAAGIYAGAFLVMSIFFTILQRHILLRKSHLLRVEMTDQRRRQIIGRSMRGLGAYIVAAAAAVLSAYVSLAICAALAVYYALPIASGGAASRLDF